MQSMKQLTSAQQGRGEICHLLRAFLSYLFMIKTQQRKRHKQALEAGYLQSLVDMR